MARPLAPRWWQRNPLWRSRAARERRARRRGREPFSASRREAEAILEGRPTMSDAELDERADALEAELRQRRNGGGS